MDKDFIEGSLKTKFLWAARVMPPLGDDLPGPKTETEPRTEPRTETKTEIILCWFEVADKPARCIRAMLSRRSRLHCNLGHRSELTSFNPQVLDWVRRLQHDIAAGRRTAPPVESRASAAAPLTEEESMSQRRRRHGVPVLDFVAGNGLVNRRALLGSGITIAGGLAAAGTATGAAAEPLTDAPWSLTVGDTLPAVQTPSPFEKDATRALTNPNGEFRTSHARTPHQRLGGTVTPNGLHFSINHSGIPNIDPAEHKLVIHGLVRQPLEFTLESLSRYPLVTRMAFVECAGNSAPMFAKEPLQTTVQMLHGLVSNAEWTGVPLSVLLDEAGVDPAAKWLIAEAPMPNSWIAACRSRKLSMTR
jgi:hypothetical protein